MDIRDCTLTAFRRWYIVGPMLILALSGVAAAYTTGPTRYSSTAVLMLTVPPTGSTIYGSAKTPNRTNPLYLADNNVTVTSAMLAQEMSGPEFARSIGLAGSGSARLSVHNGAANPELLVTGPFLFISVDGDSSTEVQEFVRRAVVEARNELQQWQVEVGAPSSTSMRLVEVMPPSSPFAGHGSKARAALAALALGSIACYATAVVADRASSRMSTAGRAVAPLPTTCSCSGPLDMRGSNAGTDVTRAAATGRLFVE